MSNFTIYLIGTVLVACGLAFAAYKLGATPIWIAIGATIVIGMGIMAAVSKTKQKDKSNTEN